MRGVYLYFEITQQKVVNNKSNRFLKHAGIFKLTACSKLVDNLGEAAKTQLVDGLWTD